MPTPTQLLYYPGITLPVVVPISMDASGDIGTIQTGFAAEFNILTRVSASASFSFKSKLKSSVVVNSSFNAMSRVYAPQQYFPGILFGLDEHPLGVVSPVFRPISFPTASPEFAWNAQARTKTSLPSLFNVRATVTRTKKAFSFNTYSRVATTNKQFLFNTLQRVLKTRQSLFNAHGLVTATRSSLFNTRQLIKPQKQVLFNTRISVTKQRQALFNALQRVSPQRQSLFNTRKRVSPAMPSLFNARLLVIRQRLVLFNTYNRVPGTPKQFLFNTRARVTPTQQSLFNTRQTLRPQLLSQFNMHRAVASQKSIAFNTLKAAPPFGGAKLNSGFRTFGRITVQKQSLFNTRQRLSAEYFKPNDPAGLLRPVVSPLSYPPSDPTQFLWNVRVLLLTQKASKFNTRARVLVSKQMLFNTSRDNVQRSSSFNVYKRVSATKAANFNTLQKVGLTTVTMEWNVGLIVQEGLRTIGRTKWISTYPG